MDSYQEDAQRQIVYLTHKFLEKNLKEVLEMFNVDSIPTLRYFVVNKMCSKVLLLHTLIWLQQSPSSLKSIDIFNKID